MLSRRSGCLMDTPVSGAGDEGGGNFNVATGEEKELRLHGGRLCASIPLQPPLKAGSSELFGVHHQFFVRQPLAPANDVRRGHGWGHGFCHRPVEIHDVVRRHLGQLICRPGGQREWFVAGPIPALHVKVGAEEIVEALDAVAHLLVGLAGRCNNADSAYGAGPAWPVPGRCLHGRAPGLRRQGCPGWRRRGRSS